MITNDQGLVAVQHRTSNGATYRVGEDDYSWEPRHNVSLAWVKPQHVSELMAVQARICCGKVGRKFFLASEVNVNLWTTGNRHGTT